MSDKPKDLKDRVIEQMAELTTRAFSDGYRAGSRLAGFTNEDAMLVEWVGHYGGNADWVIPDDKLDQLLRIAEKIRSAAAPSSGETTEP